MANDSDEPPPPDRLVARNVGVLREYSANTAEPGRSRLVLRFYRRPVRILGTDRVTGVEVERTTVDAEGRAAGTGELEVLPADLVVRSVGYRGEGLPGGAYGSDDWRHSTHGYLPPNMELYSHLRVVMIMIRTNSGLTGVVPTGTI